MAAATVGTVAVVVAVIALDVDDFCDEKEDAQDDDNLLNGTNVKFDYQVCLSDSIDATSEIMAEVRSDATVAVSEALDGTKEYSNEQWSKLRSFSSKSFSATGNKFNQLLDQGKDSWSNQLLLYDGSALNEDVEKASALVGSGKKYK